MYCASTACAAVVGCTPSANRKVEAALGVTSVAGVQLSELAVVHAGVVTLTSPKAAGAASTSATSALALTGTMPVPIVCRPLFRTVL